MLLVREERAKADEGAGDGVPSRYRPTNVTDKAYLSVSCAQQKLVSAYISDPKWARVRTGLTNVFSFEYLKKKKKKS